MINGINVLTNFFWTLTGAVMSEMSDMSEVLTGGIRPHFLEFLRHERVEADA